MKGIRKMSDIVENLTDYYIYEPDEDYYRAITGDELLKGIEIDIKKFFRCKKSNNQ